jgi:aryl-alcohol dehydrogenase-like predicted oxidoreductase
VAFSLAWTLQRPGVTSLVVGPRNVSQLQNQLAALEVDLDDGLLDEVDRVVPPGGVDLDDSYADFRPQPHHW